MWTAAKAMRTFALDTTAFPVRVVNEASLLSSTPDALGQTSHGRGLERGVGYRVQMIIKIAVATLVRTSFYVTLDADVVLTRPNTQYGDLVVDGKRALLQGGARSHDDGDSQHSEAWWEAANVILQASGCVQPHHGTVGVTPAVLSTQVAKGLMLHVTELYSLPFDAALFLWLGHDSVGADGTPELDAHDSEEIAQAELEQRRKRKEARLDPNGVKVCVCVCCVLGCAGLSIHTPAFLHARRKRARTGASTLFIGHTRARPASPTLTTWRSLSSSFTTTETSRRASTTISLRCTRCGWPVRSRS